MIVRSLKVVGSVFAWSLAFGLLFLIPLQDAWARVPVDERGEVSIIAASCFVASLAGSLILGWLTMSRRSQRPRKIILAPAIAISVAAGIILRELGPEQLFSALCAVIGLGVGVITLRVVSGFARTDSADRRRPSAFSGPRNSIP